MRHSYKSDNQIVSVGEPDYSQRVEASDEVRKYGNAASSLAYDLEARLRKAKAIAALALALAKIMESDDTINLNTTVGDIISRSV